jgi:nickel/cobalt transporter (NiCoT) family protein
MDIPPAADLWTFVILSIPTMVFLGFRHALDVDHIVAIDNLVRLHNTTTNARWIGSGFGAGHILSVLVEMVIIIYMIGSVTKVNQISFLGGIIAAVALGMIGTINLYSIKKWGKTGSTILASKIIGRTGKLGPTGSAIITGAVFGLGFDTATQISAISLSAFASATLGIQAALLLASFFAIGMVSLDTMDSILLNSIFSRIFEKKGFRYMSYALSGAAIASAALASYEALANSEILPKLTGPILAAAIIVISFGYSYVTRRNVVKDHDNMQEHKNKKN